MKTIEKLLAQLQNSPGDRQLHWGCLGALQDVFTKQPEIFEHPSTQLLLLFELLFEREYVKHQYMSPWVTGQLIFKYKLDDLPEANSRKTLFSQLAECKLFLSVLEKTYVTDLFFEAFLTQLRRSLIFEFSENQSLSTSQFRLVISLAQQSFNNEFIFVEGADERSLVSDLLENLSRRMLPDGGHPDGTALMVLAMYVPINDIISGNLALEIASRVALAPYTHALRRLVIEPEREWVLQRGIKAFGDLSNKTSQEVRSHYEANPFPKWFNVGGPYPTLESRLRTVNPDFQWSERLEGKKRILVAGCGTGQQPIGIATGNPEAEVIAVDLSLRSLAYAKRMALANDVENLEFFHGDILQLSKLGLLFHHVECVGVLHCFQDPVIGWHEIDRVLLPGGTFHVGVYGKLARLPVENVRQRISQTGFRPTLEDMKEFRRLLITEDKYDSLRKYLLHRDFFNLSMFRDLLFHEHEHCYLLAELQSIIEELNFNFMGVVFGNELKKKYASIFPADNFMSDFDNLKQFEIHYTGTLEMFRFWLQKNDDSMIIAQEPG